MSPSNEYSGLISFRIDWFNLSYQAIRTWTLAAMGEGIILPATMSLLYCFANQIVHILTFTMAYA